MGTAESETHTDMQHKIAHAHELYRDSDKYADSEYSRSDKIN